MTETMNAKKKKVVLLGDSIRLIGYGPKLPALLGGECEVWQPADNGRYSAFTLHSIMHYWQNDIRDADVIHWNNGLWDVQSGTDGQPLALLDEYLRTMCRIADILLRNTKTLIFATTTPVTAVHPDIATADIERYNAALVPLLEEKGVVIDDLFAVVAADIDRFVRKDDNIHLTEDGNTVCAETAAAVIRRYL